MTAGKNIRYLLNRVLYYNKAVPAAAVNRVRRIGNRVRSTDGTAAVYTDGKIIGESRSLGRPEKADLFRQERHALRNV